VAVAAVAVAVDFINIFTPVILTFKVMADAIL